MKRYEVVVDHSVKSQEPRQKAHAKAWRLFMSPKVADTLKEAATRRFINNDGELQEQEFKRMYKEVEHLGISQMSWKDQKALEDKRVVALGGKSKKGHKMPISMGLNIKRKREESEELKLQEGQALGMHRAKRGKKMKEKMNVENRGLKASEGLFKRGVLYVKPLPKKREGNNGLEDTFLDNKRAMKDRGKGGRKGKSKKHKGKRRR